VCFVSDEQGHASVILGSDAFGLSIPGQERLMSGNKRFIEALNGVLGELFAGNSGDFSLDANGMMAMSFGDDVEMTIQASEEKRLVLVSSSVMRITSLDTSFLKKVLELNHFELTPVGAYFALDAQQSSLLLCRVGGEELIDADALGTFLAAFAMGVTDARRLIRLNPVASMSNETPLDGDETMLRI